MGTLPVMFLVIVVNAFPLPPLPYKNSSGIANILVLQMGICSNWYFLKMLHYIIRFVNSLFECTNFPPIQKSKADVKDTSDGLCYISLIHLSSSRHLLDIRGRRTGGWWLFLGLPSCRIIFNCPSTKGQATVPRSPRV